MMDECDALGDMVGAVQEEVCIVIYVCKQTECAGTVVPVGDGCMTAAVQCMCGMSTMCTYAREHVTAHASNDGYILCAKPEFSEHCRRGWRCI